MFLRLLAVLAPMAAMLTMPLQIAGPLRAAELSERDRADIAKVEEYLTGLKPMVSRFEQTDRTYGKSRGTIYLQRPGKLRFEYDPPVPYLIVASGTWLVHYDKELQTSSYVPQDQTPAWFLLVPKVSLTGDVTVTKVSHADGILRVSVQKTASPGDGTATLEFTEQPFEIRGWTMVDAQGSLTQVVLQDPKFGESIPAKLFQFDDPSQGQKMSP